jgi:hypothetical protein
MVEIIGQTTRLDGPLAYRIRYVVTELNSWPTMDFPMPPKNLRPQKTVISNLLAHKQINHFVNACLSVLAD